MKKEFNPNKYNFVNHEHKQFVNPEHKTDQINVQNKNLTSLETDSAWYCVAVDSSYLSNQILVAIRHDYKTTIAVDAITERNRRFRTGNIN